MIGRERISVDLSLSARSWARKIAGAVGRAQQKTRGPSGPTEEAMLFVADTRPAMVAGVPHVLAVFLIVLFGESVVFVGPIWSFWVLVPYLVTRALVRKDYNAPRVALLWLQTKALSLDSHIWRGAGPAAFPIKPGKWPRGIWS